jgi:hypothetical protein
MMHIQRKEKTLQQPEDSAAATTTAQPNLKPQLLKDIQIHTHT